MKKQTGDIVEQKTSDYIIRVDRKKCISAAQCVTAFPELFFLDDKQLCSFKNDVKNVNKKKLLTSYYLCPVGAIYIYDKNGNQIIP